MHRGADAEIADISGITAREAAASGNNGMIKFIFDSTRADIPAAASETPLMGSGEATSDQE